METNTNKSTNIKNLKINKNIKNIIHKMAPLATIGGLVISMSGCSLNNSNKYYFDWFDFYNSKNTEIIKMYYNDTLSSQNMDSLSVENVPIGNRFIKNLPSSLTSLSIGNCYYLDDLSELSDICPNINNICISKDYSLTDFSFLYDLPNLKTVTISGDNIGIDDDLINYLNIKGVSHNLDDNYQINLNNKVEEIVNSIITENMNDNEKMQEIAIYVMNHIEYDHDALNNNNLLKEYNDYPLYYALKGKGVCANYAALTNALCKKSGIESYYVSGNEHSWNLVELNDKYFYIDTTNINMFPGITNPITEKILKNFDVAFFYKNDPYDTRLSLMLDINKVYNMPLDLIFEVEETNYKKNFIEKYGSNTFANVVAIIGILIGFGVTRKVVKKVKTKKKEKNN